MRQEFTLKNLLEESRNNLVLNIHHDEATEVYINGVKAADLEGFTTDYIMIPISDVAKEAINTNGRNVIAVHCNQTEGGQYIDAGLSVMSYGKPVDLNKALLFYTPDAR
ncbi:hypothetical protein NC796_03555 [Aliifodinibius sp. S!AR15-10]|uniref:hypothetical protein n=1 Tax=Aliifodinibius sp. S!AR15-10 TaxID=2950437 RepID=UPI002854A595|nr:hypothetical protein [Aliifodinibius sp. S!AR15-10]MDR8390203.1 hypothetical protein [Aliifodinibius sp. S!AR15-10]